SANRPAAARLPAARQAARGSWPARPEALRRGFPGGLWRAVAGPRVRLAVVSDYGVDEPVPAGLAALARTRLSAGRSTSLAAGRGSWLKLVIRDHQGHRHHYKPSPRRRRASP